MNMIKNYILHTTLTVHILYVTMLYCTQAVLQGFLPGVSSGWPS